MRGHFRPLPPSEAVGSLLHLPRLPTIDHEAMSVKALFLAIGVVAALSLVAIILVVSLFLERR